MVLLKPGGAKHSDCRPNMMKRFKCPRELVVDAFEPLSFLGRCACMGQEIPVVSTGAACGQFVAGQANIAPMLLPTALPCVGFSWTVSSRAGFRSSSHGFTSLNWTASEQAWHGYWFLS